jgi:hypothetical protein
VSALSQLQGDFQQYLLRGDAGALAPQVIGSARVPIATRLAIYGDAYVGRLADALGSNFPALASLMGEEDFRTLAEAYIRAHDSPFFSIRYYGDALVAFLAAEAPYAEVPVLAELARWEWCMRGVFDAADADSLDAAALKEIAPEHWALLRLQWHPSVARLDLNWNVPQLWQAVTGETAQPELAYSARPEPWLLWRQGLTTYFRSLTPAEQTLLDAARAGAPFGELCELLCAEVGAASAPAQAAALLRAWVDAGLITGARPAGALSTPP